ncbi:MAG TPA: ABC transporter ATP-binding protein [Xanthobacteraceae bacterium]|jgi:ATP-binding cassette subfamily B protein
MWIDRIKSRLSGLFGEDARTIIPRLLRTEGRKHAKGYALGFFFLFLVAASTSITAYMIKEIVNGIFVNQAYYLVWLLSAAIVTVYTVKGLAAYGATVIMAYVGNRVISDFRKRMYDSMLTQGVAYFAARHSTDFMNRLNFGANGARQVLDLVITSLGRDVLTLIGLIAVMVSQDPIVSIFGLLTLPIAVLFVRKMISRARKIVQREFGGLGEMMQTMQETAQGIRIVKSYGLEDRLRIRFQASVQSTELATNKMARVSARASPLMETLGGFAIAAAVAYTGHTVLVTGKTPGEFAAVLTALILCYEPAKRLARLNIDLSNALVGVRMLYDVLDSVPAEREEAGLPNLAVTRARVEFRDVVFAYRPVETVLQGISFTAEPGQTTALVGPSGGGKTTIMNLLERFYEPLSGEILIDGQPIAGCTRRSLREAIAYVSQDVYLFSGTVSENIAFGKPSASEDEIVAAAKAAYAHDFILGFEHGYDTEVGEHGLQLSGGQRARIAIARAFLKNAPILLLDEPTAALDSEAEHEIQRALDKLRTSRTTLVIAHRLQTVIAADKICVIEKGRVVENGRHDELIARRGRYHKVYEVQFHVPQAASA